MIVSTPTVLIEISFYGDPQKHGQWQDAQLCSYFLKNVQYFENFSIDIYFSFQVRARVARSLHSFL